MTSFRICILFVLCIALGTSPASAGGWTQNEGDIYIKATYGSTSANTIYRFDGALKYPTDNGATTVRDWPMADRSLFLYTEYGLLDDLTLIGTTALRRSIITTPVERRVTEGLSDIGLQAKYRLTTFSQQVLSLTAGLTIPTGYSRDLEPALGTGTMTFDLAANWGISLYPIPAYATASVGYHLRPSVFISTLSDPQSTFDPNYADEILATAEAGYTFADRVLVHGMVNFLTTTRMDQNDFDINHPPETERFLKLGGGAIVLVTHGFSLSADAFATPYGRKTANSIDLMLGVSWQGSIGSPFASNQTSPMDAPLDTDR